MFTLAGVLIASIIVLGAAEAHRRRAQMRRFQWQFATYDGGRVVHATPVGDVEHIEDHPDDCSCSPWSERFERRDGSYGNVIYHHRVRR